MGFPPTNSFLRPSRLNSAGSERRSLPLRSSISSPRTHSMSRMVMRLSKAMRVISCGNFEGRGGRWSVRHLDISRAVSFGIAIPAAMRSSMAIWFEERLRVVRFGRSRSGSSDRMLLEAFNLRSAVQADISSGRLVNALEWRLRSSRTLQPASGGNGPENWLSERSSTRKDSILKTLFRISRFVSFNRFRDMLRTVRCSRLGSMDGRVCRWFPCRSRVCNAANTSVGDGFSAASVDSSKQSHPKSSNSLSAAFTRTRSTLSYHAGPSVMPSISSTA